MESNNQNPAAVLAEKAVSAEPIKPQVEGAQEDLYSPKFAALSRREKMLRDKEKEFEARRMEFEEKSKGSQAELQTLEQLKKENPLKWLEKQGVDFANVAKIYLNDGAIPEDVHAQKLQARIDELEQKLEGKFKSIESQEEEARKAQEEAALSQFKSDINQFVQSNAGDYELINELGQSDLVFEVVAATWERSGGKKLLTNKEAADLVESHLLENAKKLTKLKKLQEAEPQPQKLSEAVTMKPKAQSNFSATLTNKHSSEIPAPSSETTQEARWRRAMAVLSKN